MRARNFDRAFDEGEDVDANVAKSAALTSPASD